MEFYQAEITNFRFSDFMIRMRISSQIQEIDLALNFGKIGRHHCENFHFSWERVPNQIPRGSGRLNFYINKV
jgi:hypothetical protein